MHHTQVEGTIVVASSENKPFACKAKNCAMTFTNEDHLNSHRKKHTMGFNFELNSKNNETGDQTPTPTRFFRSCEEMGLFQDLQNVNPFEETFKKALETSENKLSKLENRLEICNEDTLHTPHIFPLVEEPLHANMLDTNIRELSIVNLIEIPQIRGKGHAEEDKHTNSKIALKQAVLRKSSGGKNKQTRELLVSSKPNNIKKSNETSQQLHIERVRETNRHSQIRCRQRKKKQMKEMLSELMNLRKENSGLKKENSKFKQRFIYLWKVIEDLGANKDDILTKMNETLEKHDKDQSVNPIVKKLPSLTPLIPKIALPPAPIVFKLVPVQIFNTPPSNAVSSTSTQSNIEKQKFIP